MKRKTMEKALKNLLDQYGIAVKEDFSFTEAENTIGIDGLIAGYKLNGLALAAEEVPLLMWRVRRSFTELRKIVQEATVEDVCLLRFSYYGAAGEDSIANLIYQKLDLCEYITGSEIKSVFATWSNQEAVNIIAKLNSGVICSIEINLQLPEGALLQERHEIIGRRGTACDRVVDTQIQQHSIYCFTKDEDYAYTDTEMELYGLSVKQIELIRAAFELCKNKELKDIWLDQHQHLENLLKAVITSGKIREKVLI